MLEKILTTNHQNLETNMPENKKEPGYIPLSELGLQDNATIAKQRFDGTPYTRLVDSQLKISGLRRSRLVRYFREATAETGIIRASWAHLVPPSDLKGAPRRKVSELDLANLVGEIPKDSAQPYVPIHDNGNPKDSFKKESLELAKKRESVEKRAGKIWQEKTSRLNEQQF